MRTRRIGRAAWPLAIAATLVVGPHLWAQQGPARVIRAKAGPAAATKVEGADKEFPKELGEFEKGSDTGAMDAEMKGMPEASAPETSKGMTPAERRAQRRANRQKGEGPAASPKLPGRPERVVEAPTLDAAGVDALLAEHLSEAKVKPAGLASDGEFLRRVYLDVAGTLPTPEKIAAFRRDTKKDKRAKVIDELLASPEAARNLARYWRDVVKFRATNENANQVRYQALEDWLAGEFAKNTPWDEIAAEMITASGSLEEVGAANFTAAYSGQAVELAGEVSRVFLGVQIQCAQCHDHPNDPWKREQFHEFAAFFAGARVRPTPMTAKAVAEAKAAKTSKADGKAKKAQVRREFEVQVQGTPKYTMPDLKDPQKQIPVAPKFFLASSSEAVPAQLPAARRRELAASYVTGQDNPWFAKAFVNRAWGLFMGEGFVNPVDDLGPTRTPEAAAVLEALAGQWQRGGYDVRWLYRTILNTRAYQREFRATNSAAGRTAFAANTPSRLRADQILDALSDALDAPLDERTPGAMLREIGPLRGKNRAEIREKVKEQVAAQGKGAFRSGPRGQFNTLFGVDPSTPADDVLGTIPQALYLMNDAKVNKAMQAKPGTMLGQLLKGHPDNRSALEALYTRVLARRPTPAEIGACNHHLKEVGGDRVVAFEDILWCLINSTEFVSRR